MHFKITIVLINKYKWIVMRITPRLYDTETGLEST